MAGYKELVVWQKADELAFRLYTLSRKFPREDIYGITSQLRRAAISVPTNIAEGSGRHGRGETRQFANIALGSLAELEYLMGFCNRLGFFSHEEYGQVLALKDEVGALLWCFYKSF